MRYFLQNIFFYLFFFILSVSAQDSITVPNDTINGKEYGTLIVTSIPSNAQITINGEKTDSKTPATISGLSIGTYTIELSLPDYLFAQRKVKVIADSTITISFNLISLSDTAHVIGDLKLGILRLPMPPISTPYLVDNVHVYYQDVTLNAGKHHVVWEGGNRYSSLDTIVEIFSGKLTTFKFSPERLSGTLIISPFPRDADIYINETLYSTGELKVTLHSSTYTIKIERNGYFPFEKDIIIVPNKETNLEIDLDRIPDRDQDGFLDSCDKCPDEYGLYNGCPKQIRRDAFKMYKDILIENLKKQPLIFSINTIGYIYRTPTNSSFKEFLSYFNNGSLYFNNQNSIELANTYNVSYHGIFLSCELGQWFSGLEYKKNNYNPLKIKTKVDQYYVVFDTTADIKPSIFLPSTSISAGFNIFVKKFNIACSFGYQWEDIVILDIVTVDNMQRYWDGELRDINNERYIGPKTDIVFNNNWWFSRLCFLFDLAESDRAIPTFYTAFTLSFGSKKKTGWHKIQAGILYKFFLSSKQKQQPKNEKSGE